MEVAIASRLYAHATWKLTLAVVASTLLLSARIGSPTADLLLLWTLVPWFSGLADLARAKGRSSWLALAGVLHVAGLILLIVMPSRPPSLASRHEPI